MKLLSRLARRVLCLRLPRATNLRNPERKKHSQFSKVISFEGGVVFSLGSNNDISFEADFQTATARAANIITVDMVRKIVAEQEGRRRVGHEIAHFFLECGVSHCSLRTRGNQRKICTRNDCPKNGTGIGEIYLLFVFHSQISIFEIGSPQISLVFKQRFREN